MSISDTESTTPEKPIPIGLTERRRLIATALEAMVERMTDQEKLPPERVLAKNLQVSRAMLREALGRLEAEGKVWRHVGQGTFVGNKPSLRRGWRSFSAAHTSPTEILEVRMLFEPRIAAVAALRATDIQIGDLKTLANKCRSTTNSETWELWDSQFHKTLCELAGNALLLAIYEGINTVRRTARWRIPRDAVLTATKRDRYVAQHQDIIDAISARDSDGAYEAMTSHIELVTADLVSQEVMSLPFSRRYR